MVARMSARGRTFAFVVVSSCTALAAPAVLADSPERAQREAEAGYLPKVNYACAAALSLQYDGDSLRAHNQDIRYDQTDGALVCNEPLRYLWYACKTPAGKAAVQAAKLERIVCKGTAAKTGAF